MMRSDSSFLRIESPFTFSKNHESRSKEKLYPNSCFSMSNETFETYIRQLIESQRTPEVTISWQGGEPTFK